MPPAIALDPEQCQAILLRWEKDGPSDDDEQVASFVGDISNAAQSATSVDQAFEEVQRILWLVVLVGWPNALIPWREWKGYKKRWRKALKSSIRVVSANIKILERFDEVYLAKVETIQTEQDRLAAIALLTPFIAELDNDDKSASLSREFLELKRDIEAFVDRYNLSAHETAIKPMLKDIEVLDEEISVALKAVAASNATMVAALRIGAKASPVIASLQEQRESQWEAHSVASPVINSFRFRYIALPQKGRKH